jgi:hypothetical protein
VREIERAKEKENDADEDEEGEDEEEGDITNQGGGWASTPSGTETMGCSVP